MIALAMMRTQKVRLCAVGYCMHKDSGWSRPSERLQSLSRANGIGFDTPTVGVSRSQSGCTRRSQRTCCCEQSDLRRASRLMSRELYVLQICRLQVVGRAKMRASSGSECARPCASHISHLHRKSLCVQPGGTRWAPEASELPCLRDACRRLDSPCRIWQHGIYKHSLCIQSGCSHFTCGLPLLHPHYGKLFVKILNTYTYDLVKNNVIC